MELQSQPLRVTAPKDKELLDRRIQGILDARLVIGRRVYARLKLADTLIKWLALLPVGILAGILIAGGDWLGASIFLAILLSLLAIAYHINCAIALLEGYHSKQMLTGEWETVKRLNANTALFYTEDLWS